MFFTTRFLAFATVLTSVVFAPSISAQYQSTTPIFQFRTDQSSPFKRLYFFGTSGERLDRSEYYFVLKKEEQLKNGAQQFELTIPRDFYKRFKSATLNVCTMQRGGFVRKTKCLDDLGFASAFDDEKQSVVLSLDNAPPTDQDIAFYASLINPISSGLYQFNVLAGLDKVNSKKYLGSWLISVN
tara:strand:- start:204 stop:755 length:552 start_codon:yes stop_codon:yes gene_type:complete